MAAPVRDPVAAATAHLELDVPAAAATVLRALRGASYEAYLVGGCVRDALLRREVSDWDVTTSARPEQIAAVFTGAKVTNRFGTVLVPDGAGDVIEVTTYRIDGEYGDHRRPDAVRFTDRLLDDLSRRDFTMNAMAYADGQLIDPFGGARDLAARRLRTVGAAGDRFGEDALRMMRAARFIAVLGLAADPELEGAMRERAPELAHVSRERVLMEMEKTLRAPRPSSGFRLLARTGALEHAFPRLAATVGVVQTKKRGFDVFEHTLECVDAVPLAHAEARMLRWAALCHDLGKPQTASDGHFFHHDVLGAQLTSSALRQLTMDRDSIRRISHLVRWHMFWFAGEWTGAAIRRFVRNVGLENVPLLLELRRADVRGGGKQDARFPALSELERRIQRELDAQHAFALRDLAIDGTVLMRELSLAPGPEVGRLLRALFEEVLERPERNEPGALLARARELQDGVPAVGPVDAPEARTRSHSWACLLEPDRSVCVCREA